VLISILVLGTESTSNVFIFRFLFYLSGGVGQGSVEDFDFLFSFVSSPSMTFSSSNITSSGTEYLSTLDEN
jgi:hypothetical protein